MAVKRNFLGWEHPVLSSVCQYVLGDRQDDVIDLRDQLVVVTTRHAGRRLREGLASEARKRGTSVLAPLVVQPHYFFRPQSASAPLASDLQMLAVFSEILVAGKENELSGLLPELPSDRSAAWCHGVASMILKLRKTLQNHRYTIAGFVEQHGDDLIEADRWNQLVELENKLLHRLKGLRLRDPVTEGMHAAEHPQVPSHINRILLAANPDPAIPAIHALDVLKDRLPIEVLIHAPESRAADFDEWGRPVPEAWMTRALPLPSPERVYTSGSAPAQVERVLDIMARLPEHFGPLDISVALPDTRYADRLDIRLGQLNIGAFDPSGDALVHHPMFSLLRAMRSFAMTDHWSAFYTVAVHEHILQWLNVEEDFDRVRWLKALDQWREDDIPQTFTRSMKRWMERGRAEDWMIHALKSLAALRDRVREAGHVQDAVQQVCTTVYAHRRVGRANARDDAFRQAAECLQTALQEWRDTDVNLSMFEAWGLILRALSQQAVYTDRSESSVALEGWLELHWSPAPVLIVTGMHEGYVPDTKMEDIFLPETLRAKLGLESDQQRFARDAFLYESCFQSRQKNGEVHMVMGRLGPDQAPLKPSRLLLAAHDPEEMMKRCDLFFSGEIHEEELPDLTRPSIQLDPSQASLPPARAQGLTTLSVSGLDVYLRCPFTFYLDKMLRMEVVDAAKSELDAADFGSLAHDVLKLFSQPEVKAMTDGNVLSGMLAAELDRLVKDRYGSDHPLFLRIQLDALLQRLHWAALRDVELRAAGWETQYTELEVECELNGINLRGRIDRIDRHPDYGLRMVDYKTTSSMKTPEENHLVKPKTLAGIQPYRICPDGSRVWTGLQLPIYTWMAEQHLGEPVLSAPAYFNLPKAVRETGVYAWKNYDNSWTESAKACAQGVIEDIQNWAFWPPGKDSLDYDLGELFPGSLEPLLDEVRFEAFLDAKRREVTT